MVKKLAILLFFALTTLLFCWSGFAQQEVGLSVVRVSELPNAAQQTIRLIKQNGPFLYEKDGMIFGNYERLLPKKKRGYYREYTVPTSRTKTRGAQRIVVGGNPPTSSEFYYTSDHYTTFKIIQFSGR